MHRQRQVLQRRRVAPEGHPDHRLGGPIAPGDLRYRMLDHALGRLEFSLASAVRIAPVRLNPVLVMLPSENGPVLCLQGPPRDRLRPQLDRSVRASAELIPLSL